MAENKDDSKRPIYVIKKLKRAAAITAVRGKWPTLTL